LLTSARRDFGIPAVFGMVSGVLDEKKSIPDAHKLSDYGRDSDPKPASCRWGRCKGNGLSAFDRESPAPREHEKLAELCIDLLELSPSIVMSSTLGWGNARVLSMRPRLESCTALR